MVTATKASRGAGQRARRGRVQESMQFVMFEDAERWLDAGGSGSGKAVRR